MKNISVLLILPVIFLISCTSQSTSPEASHTLAAEIPTATREPVQKEEVSPPTETTPPQEEPEAATATSPPPATATLPPPSATTAPSATEAPQAPPAEPQRIEFTSEDGRTLVGTFYPSSFNPAPIVVLMHEGLAERSQMESLALWLQNRPNEITAGPTGKTAYDWMPAYPKDIDPVAVFAFDLRGHGESEGPMPSNEQAIEYTMDIRAAIALAKTLAGVDPKRVISIGASMFADAALNGCIALDGTEIISDQPGNDCAGVLSLSPFDFSGVPFDQAVDAFLSTPSMPILWCLHSEDDYQPETCRAIAGKERAYAEIYAGEIHGVSFLQPGLDPDVGQILVDFLLTSLNCPNCP